MRSSTPVRASTSSRNQRSSIEASKSANASPYRAIERDSPFSANSRTSISTACIQRTERAVSAAVHHRRLSSQPPPAPLARTTGSATTPGDDSTDHIASAAHDRRKSIDSSSQKTRSRKSSIDTSGNIRVVCRFRPQNALEESSDGKPFVSFDDTNRQVHVNPDGLHDKETFVFDHVLAPNATQQMTYEEAARPIVEGLFFGYNGTVLAYGQTSSGKTYTMEGPSTEDLDTVGIIPRMIDDIFAYIAQEESHINFTIRVSMVEIYREHIRDLLDPDVDGKEKIRLFEDKHKVVHISGATECYIGTSNDIVEVLDVGKANRAVASTKMNAASSRSHSIFTLTLVRNDTEEMSSTTAKLCLVDLAGSENSKKTEASGITLSEAKLINRSLLTLGRVINALTTPNSMHIPYRDSKLTHMIQDALGGNSRTCLIINCSPSTYNRTETIETLRFGKNAKRMVNKPKVNKVYSMEELKRMLEQRDHQIETLKKKLSQKTSNSESSNDSLSSVNASQGVKELQKRIKELEDELSTAKIQKEDDTMMSKLEEMEERCQVAEQKANKHDIVQKENEELYEELAKQRTYTAQMNRMLQEIAIELCYSIHTFSSKPFPSKIQKLLKTMDTKPMISPTREKKNLSQLFDAACSSKTENNVNPNIDLTAFQVMQSQFEESEVVLQETTNQSEDASEPTEEVTTHTNLWNSTPVGDIFYATKWVLEETNQQLTNLYNESCVLQQQKDHTSNRRIVAEEQIKRIQTQLQQSQQELQTLRTYSHTMKESVYEFMVSYQKDIQNCVYRIVRQFSQEFTASKSHLEVIQTEISQLLSSNHQSMHMTIQEIMEKVKYVDQGYQSNKRVSNALKYQVQSLERSLQEQKFESAANLATIEELRRELHDQDIKSTNNRQSMKDLDIKNGELQAEIRNYTTRIDELKQEKEEIQQTLHDTKISLQQIQSNYTQAVKDKEIAERISQTVQSNEKEAGEISAALRTHLEHARHDYQDQLEKCRTLEQQIIDTNESHTKAMRELKESHEQELELLQSDTRQQFTTLSTQLEKKQKQCDTIESELKDLNIDYSKYKEETESANLQHTHTYEQLSFFAHDVMAQLQRLNERNSELQGQIETLEIKNTVETQQLNKIQTQQQDLQQKYDQQVNEYTELLANYQSDQSQIETLKADLDTTKMEKETITEQLNTKMDEYDKLRQNASTLLQREKEFDTLAHRVQDALAKPPHERERLSSPTNRSEQKEKVKHANISSHADSNSNSNSTVHVSIASASTSTPHTSRSSTFSSDEASINSGTPVSRAKRFYHASTSSTVSDSPFELQSNSPSCSDKQTKSFHPSNSSTDHPDVTEIAEDPLDDLTLYTCNADTLLKTFEALVTQVESARSEAEMMKDSLQNRVQRIVSLEMALQASTEKFELLAAATGRPQFTLGLEYTVMQRALAGKQATLDATIGENERLKLRNSQLQSTIDRLEMNMAQLSKELKIKTKNSKSQQLSTSNSSNHPTPSSKLLRAWHDHSPKAISIQSMSPRSRQVSDISEYGTPTHSSIQEDEPDENDSDMSVQPTEDNEKKSEGAWMRVLRLSGIRSLRGGDSKRQTSK